MQIQNALVLQRRNRQDGNSCHFGNCDLDCNTPRICSPEYDGNGNFPAEVVDSPEFRERMQELLDQILKYFEAKESEEEEIC